MSLSPAKQKFVDLASEMYGAGETLDKEMVIAVCETNHVGWPSWFLRAPYRVERGQFKLPVEGESITPVISKPVVRPIIILQKVWSLVKIHCTCRLVTSMTFTVS